MDDKTSIHSLIIDAVGPYTTYTKMLLVWSLVLYNTCPAVKRTPSEPWDEKFTTE